MSAIGQVENGVGQIGELFGDVGERGHAQHVAQHDAQQLAAAETGQVDCAAELRAAPCPETRSRRCSYSSTVSTR